MGKSKCWSPAFSPFSTMFSEVFFLNVVKAGIVLIRSNLLSADVLSLAQTGILLFCKELNEILINS